MGGHPAGPRRASVPGFDTGDWRTGGPGGRGVHFVDGTLWQQVVPRGGNGAAPAAGAGGRLAGDGLFVVPLLSGCARQRRAPDKSGFVRARREYFVRNGHRKILLHFGHACQRYSPRARGPGGASGRGNCLGARKVARASYRESESAAARGRNSGDCGRVQHTARGRAVFAGRGSGRFARAGIGVGGAGFGDFVGDVAVAARK